MGHPNTRVTSVEGVGDDCFCHSPDICDMMAGRGEEAVACYGPESFC